MPMSLGVTWSRLPPGRRGLKHPTPLFCCTRARSPSPRKAWIETREVALESQEMVKSPSPRKAWIETRVVGDQARGVGESPSPRKAWIETVYTVFLEYGNEVAFPPEGVD